MMTSYTMHRIDREIVCLRYSELREAPATAQIYYW